MKQPSHPFGDLLHRHLGPRRDLSQKKLAAGINRSDSAISHLCHGRRLEGRDVRNTVLEIAGWLHSQGALAYIDEANALLDAAGKDPLSPDRSEDLDLLGCLRERPKSQGRADGDDPRLAPSVTVAEGFDHRPLAAYWRRIILTTGIAVLLISVAGFALLRSQAGNGRRTAIVYIPGQGTDIVADKGIAHSEYWDRVVVGLEAGGISKEVADILLYGYAGGRMTELNTWAPASYSCKDSYGSLSRSGERLRQLMHDYAKDHPDTDFVLIGNSLGGTVAWDTAAREDESLEPVGARVVALVLLGSPLSNPGKRVYEVGDELLKGTKPCRGIDARQAVRGLLLDLPSEDDRDRLFERLIRDGVDLLPFISTGSLLRDTGRPSKNSNIVECNFGDGNSYIDSEVVWRNVSSFIRRVHIEKDREGFDPSC